MALTDGRLCWTYLCTSVIECTRLRISCTDSTCLNPLITDGTPGSPFSPYDTCVCASSIDSPCLCTSSIDAICLYTSSFIDTCIFFIDNISLGTPGTDGQLYPSSLQLQALE